MQLNYCPSDGLEGLCLVDRLCGTKEQCVLLPFRAGHFAKVEGRKVVFDWYLYSYSYLCTSIYSPGHSGFLRQCRHFLKVRYANQHNNHDLETSTIASRPLFRIAVALCIDKRIYLEENEVIIIGRWWAFRNNFSSFQGTGTKEA